MTPGTEPKAGPKIQAELRDRTTDRDARGRPLRVLLAEDTAMNQEVLSLLLQRRGYSVVAVENGRAALAALEKQPCDIALIDIEMPELDGLQTTRAIRQKEKQTRLHLPIVAMTGHSTEEDRKRCLEAGMDDYLAKPIRTDQLYKTLERLAPKPPSAQAGRPQSISPPSAPEERGLLQRLGGDKKLYRRIVTAFLAEYPKRMRALRRALAEEDWKGLASAAHALKGSVGNFDATEAVECARQLEAMARRGELSGIKETCAALEEKLAALAESLRAAGARPSSRPQRGSGRKSPRRKK